MYGFGFREDLKRELKVSSLSILAASLLLVRGSQKRIEGPKTSGEFSSQDREKFEDLKRELKD